MPDEQKEPDTEPTSEPVEEPVAEEAPPAEPVEAEKPTEPEPAPEAAFEPPVEAEKPQIEVPAEALAEAEETTTPEEVPPATISTEESPPETAQSENEPFSEATPEPPQEQLKDVPEVEVPTEPASSPAYASQPTPQTPLPPFANFTIRAREMLVKARATIQSKKRKKLDKILVLLDKKKNIANDDVEKLLHVSDATATRYLNQLEKEGKIIQVGKTGQSVRYVKM